LVADGAQDAALTRPAADNVLQMWPVSKMVKSTQADGEEDAVAKVDAAFDAAKLGTKPIRQS
jgi:hypothetical protein